MAIITSLKKILVTDSLQSYASLINENFKVVATALDAISTVVDTDKKSISTIKELSLLTGNINTANPSVTNFTTNASARIDGHLIVGFTITAGSAFFSNSGGSAVTINAGSLNITSSESVINNAGDLITAGRTVDSSINKILRANQLASFTGGEGGVSHYTALTMGFGDETSYSPKCGFLSATKMSTLLLDLTTYSDTSNESNVRYFKLLTTGALNGQQLKVISVFNKTGASGEIPDINGTFAGVRFVTENIVIPNAAALVAANYATSWIQINEPYMSLDFVFYNNNWILLNDFNTSVANEPIFVNPGT